MSFDIAFYGGTPGGVAGAYEARRQGLRPIILGGWRERHLGGMMSGGLGGTDLHGLDSLTGLGRTILDRITSMGARGRPGVKFEPRFAERVFEALVAEADIPVVWADGLVGVERDAKRLRSIILRDGSRIEARYFADCGYEGDLMAAAGVTYTVGREARDRRNRLNGFRGRKLTARGDGHNWIGPAANVDPFVRPGEPDSGLAAGVSRRPKIRWGEADRRVQAYCFRMIMTADPERRVDLPDAPPPGFDPASYELLFRYLAAWTDSGAVYGDVFSLGRRLLLMKPLARRTWDVNNRGPFSLDLIGGSETYPEGDAAEREAVWKRHENHIRGFFYALQHHRDERVPPPLRAAVRTMGLDAEHFTRPHPNDEPHWPYQLYVRESRRMVGDSVLTAADLTPATPMGRPVANGAYRKDSHHVQRYAYLEGERWRVWNEGNFEKRVAGGRFSIPYGVLLPRRAEIENLFVGFCVSATHEAFGAVRMEPSLMGLGQAIGAAAAIAIESGDIAVQDVEYDSLRRRLSEVEDAVPFEPREDRPVA